MSFQSSIGLDSAVSKQLIDYLHKLCHRPRMTVIAVIHQPSFELFLKFHNAYVLDRGGKCLYSGQTSTLINYIQDHQLTCPKFYNPADFILDLAQGDFGDEVQQRMREHQQKSIASLTNVKGHQRTQDLNQLRFRPSQIKMRQVMLLAKQWTVLSLNNRTLFRMQMFIYLLGPLLFSTAVNRSSAYLTGCPPYHLLQKTSLNYSTVQSMTDLDWNEFEFENGDLQLQNIGYLRQFNGDI